MASAFRSAFRSHDTQSKVGAILVNTDNREVGRGRNGFPSDIDKTDLPTTRPNKYPLMVHAEINALANMVIKPDVASLYVTRMPCVNCSKALWQNNVRVWNVPASCVDFSLPEPKIKHYTEEDEQLFEVLIHNGLIINYLDFSIADLLNMVKENEKYFEYLS
jgi:tRNA(Arg) A34 adenosine deaminase TadA